jgi:hypothetical protein
MSLRLSEEQSICSTFMGMLHMALNLNQVNNAQHFMFYHIPNGQRSGNRTQRIIQGKLDKIMGARKGVPDYFFSWLATDLKEEMPFCKHGYLEAKTPKGRLLPEQRDFKNFCETAGVNYAIFKSPEEGINILKKWGIIKQNFNLTG